MGRSVTGENFCMGGIGRNRPSSGGLSSTSVAVIRFWLPSVRATRQSRTTSTCHVLGSLLFSHPDHRSEDPVAPRTAVARPFSSVLTRASTRVMQAVRASFAPSIAPSSAPRRERSSRQSSRRAADAALSVRAASSAQAPPAVVSTTTFAEANEAELLKACELFAPGDAFVLSDTSGGVNNHVRYCDCDDGSRYVVRLYNLSLIHI